MTLAEELQWRGFVQNTTFEDIALLDQKEKWIFYIGFDASASSQTVGNLASMMAGKVFLRHGHQAIILAGGATSLIGDPGGKDKERTLLDKQEVANNISHSLQQFRTIFEDTDQGGQIKYVNNLDWYQDFKLLDFLRDIGKNFSMTPLIQRDYIASRLGADSEGISYAEFSYTLLQGYDYLRLFEDYRCNLQLGGSDQWGNCLSGIDLIRRKHRVNVHALTLPLIINKATGKKFGKSEEQTIWLDGNLTHPSDFYQFWLNTSDTDVIEYLKIFTALPKKEVDRLEIEQQRDPSRRQAQKRLAQETTRLVHGDQDLRICQALSRLAFDNNAITSNEIADIDQLFSRQAQQRQLVISISGHNDLENILDELIHKVPSLESRGQIKRLLQANAIKVATLQAGKLQLPESHLQTLSDLTALEAVFLSEDRKPSIMIIGKNTIRSLNIQVSAG